MSASLVRTLVGGLVQVAGNSVQGILAVYWTDTHLSPYGSMLFILTFLFCGFFLTVCGLAAATRDASFFLLADTPAQRAVFRRLPDGRWTLAQVMLGVSAVNTVAAVSAWYATPPSHTPPLIQAILGSAPIVAAIPMSKLVLGDTKRYCAWQPMTAVALVLASIVVSLLPSLLDGSGETGFGGWSTVGWCLVYLASQVPTGAALTVQQAFLIRAGALQPGVSRLQTVKYMFRMMMYNQVLVLGYVSTLFWLDLLPWFGSSDSMTAFSVATRYSFTCSVAGPRGVADLATPPGVSCATATPAYAFGFIAAYMVMLIGVSALNIESAVFNTVCFVLNTMVLAVFWYIPGANPEPDTNPPVWSVAVALVLSLTGVVLFKRWEMASPVATQFRLAAATEAAGDDSCSGDAGGGSGYGNDATAPLLLSDSPRGVSLAPLSHVAPPDTIN